jgi:hypothetical protein
MNYSGDPAHVAMPGVHRIASLLKCWIRGNRLSRYMTAAGMPIGNNDQECAMELFTQRKRA